MLSAAAIPVEEAPPPPPSSAPVPLAAADAALRASLSRALRGELARVEAQLAAAEALLASGARIGAAVRAVQEALPQLAAEGLVAPADGAAPVALAHVVRPQGR